MRNITNLQCYDCTLHCIWPLFCYLAIILLSNNPNPNPTATFCSKPVRCEDNFKTIFAF